MRTRLRGIVMALALPAILAGPAAHAEFSNQYQLFKAVKDRDYYKINTMVSQPGGASLINIPDPVSRETVLHLAVDQSNLGLVVFLLQRGADPEARDGDGNTALILSAIKGFGDGVKYLLTFKAQINATNRSGETALIKAVQQGNEPIVRALIEAGAKVDIADSVTGMTALDYAQRSRRGARLVQIMEGAGRKTAAPATVDAAPATP